METHSFEQEKEISEKLLINVAKLQLIQEFKSYFRREIDKIEYKNIPETEYCERASRLKTLEELDVFANSLIDEVKKEVINEKRE